MPVACPNPGSPNKGRGAPPASVVRCFRSAKAALAVISRPLAIYSSLPTPTPNQHTNRGREPRVAVEYPVAIRLARRLTFAGRTAGDADPAVHPGRCGPQNTPRPTPRCNPGHKTWLLTVAVTPLDIPLPRALRLTNHAGRHKLAICRLAHAHVSDRDPHEKTPSPTFPGDRAIRANSCHVAPGLIS